MTREERTSSTPEKRSRREVLYGGLAGSAAIAAAPLVKSLGGSAAAAGTGGSRPGVARFQDEERTKVVHWAHPMTEDDMTFFDPLVQQFQDAGNAIDVQIELQPWDARVEQKLAAFAAGTSPDSSYLNSDEFAQYAEQGAIHSIDNYVTPEDLDDLLPGPLAAMEWDGVRYMFPLLFIPTYPFYNRELFEKSGLDPDAPPVTWDELDEQMSAILAAKDAGAHDAWPLAIPELEGASVTFNPWFYQAGGQLLNDDGTSGYDSPAGVDGASFAVHLADSYNSPGNAGAQYGVLEDQFFTGQTAYQIMGEHRVIKRWLDEFPDFQLDVAAPPGRDVQAAIGGTGAVGIWASSGNEHPDEAWAWTHFLTNEGNLAYNQGAGFVPARKSVLADYTVDAHPMVLKAIEVAFPHCIIAEKHPQVRDMWAALTPQMQAAFAGDITPEEAVRTAAETINSDVLAG
jgi:ABC-type glycerol-3-phosphate transport system substrate-binding protein